MEIAVWLSKDYSSICLLKGFYNILYNIKVKAFVIWQTQGTQNRAIYVSFCICRLRCSFTGSFREVPTEKRLMD